jgi:hypothetical protein
MHRNLLIATWVSLLGPISSAQAQNGTFDPVRTANEWKGHSITRLIAMLESSRDRPELVQNERTGSAILIVPYVAQFHGTLCDGSPMFNPDYARTCSCSVRFKAANGDMIDAIAHDARWRCRSSGRLPRP